MLAHRDVERLVAGERTGPMTFTYTLTPRGQRRTTRAIGLQEGGDLGCPPAPTEVATHQEPTVDNNDADRVDVFVQQLRLEAQADQVFALPLSKNDLDMLGAVLDQHMPFQPQHPPGTRRREIAPAGDMETTDALRARRGRARRLHELYFAVKRGFESGRKLYAGEHI